MAFTLRGWNNSQHLEPGQTGKTNHTDCLAQVEPTASTHACDRGSSSVKGWSLPQSDSSNLVWHDTLLGGPDEDTHVTRTIGCATAPTKTAARQEAASAQVGERGHQVTMIEVPDNEDDTSF